MPPLFRAPPWLVAFAAFTAFAGACTHASTPITAAPQASPSASASAVASTIAAPAARLSPAEIAARALPSICSVRTEHALGTGFFVDGTGIVATNLHVVAGEPRIAVIFADKHERFVTEIAGYSEHYDLALLRVDPASIPPLALGDSDALRPGDPIVAIGNPLGLDDTVSNGLVSAVRAVDATLTILQISAPIAPGSSGGPIFDDRGGVVGIATAIVRGGENLAFGVPSRYLRELLAAPQSVSLSAFAAHFAKRPTHPALPRPTRAVPHHAVTMLAGCSEAALKLTLDSIGSAIDVGAPLYNQGNFAACYHEYEGAAQDLERKLPGACKGPIKALAAGRAKASGLGDSSDQAWAMRDAFDGVVEVIVRKAQGKTD